MPTQSDKYYFPARYLGQPQKQYGIECDYSLLLDKVKKDRAKRRRDIKRTPYYFAYGSNMHLWQMKGRCLSAVSLGKVITKGERVVARGVADLVSTPGHVAHGVLWRITPDCLRSLDSYEGCPWLYRRELIRVVTVDKRTVRAWVYRMVLPYSAPDRPFSPTYAATCLLGAVYHGITAIDVWKNVAAPASGQTIKDGASW